MMSVTSCRWLLSRCRRARQGRDGRDRDVVTENPGGGTGSATAAIEHDVVRPGCKSEIDICFDVIGGKLESDWNSTADFPYAIGKAGEILRGGQVGKGRR